MDKTTRDLFALINAHSALLQALYVREFKGILPTLKAVEDELTTRLKKPPQRPDPFDQQQAVEIQAPTLDAVWVFFREVESKIQEGSMV